MYLKKAVENSRRNNFNFGDDKNENITSHAIAFTNKLGISKSNQNLKRDIAEAKGAHFSFGHTGTHYVSSYKDTHNQAVVDGKDPTLNEVDQKERNNRQRVQQFSYGSHTPDYTSSFKGSFVPHGPTSGANTQAAKENSKEVRKSHFNFGTDGNFMQQQ